MLFRSSSAVAVEAEVPTMMSSGWVISEAEQCQPCGAVTELPIVITVLPVVKVDVVNFPAVEPPTKVPSSNPPLEVNVAPVEVVALTQLQLPDASSCKTFVPDVFPVRMPHTVPLVVAHGRSPLVDGGVRPPFAAGKIFVTCEVRSTAPPMAENPRAFAAPDV